MVYAPPPMVGDCAVVSVTPSEQLIAIGDSFLSVANDLTGYTGAGALVWPATECIQCPNDDLRCSAGPGHVGLLMDR
jgi:hypothetical protein